VTEAVKLDEHYTYADLQTWDDGKRYELIDGTAYEMASPNRLHQEIHRETFGQLYNFLKGKPCKMYPAPFEVRLFPQKDDGDDTYVEPDIIVVCDHSKLDDRGCKGAPDLIIEILSPSTASMDAVYKLNKYQKAKVREYWIIDPDNKILLRYTLENEIYSLSQYEFDKPVPVTVLPGCAIDLSTAYSESI
jgi:Uma2 family endonuclease